MASTPPRTDPLALVGRRFATDFVIEAIHGDVALLRRAGAAYVISVEELLVVIEREFVVEKGAES